MEKDFTEEKIRGIIEECVKKVLNEMAVPRKEYVDYAHHISYTLMEHLIKICLYEDIVPQCVSHWRSEIYNFSKPIVMDRLKNGISKEKAFDQGAITMPFGEDLNEFDASFFQSVIDMYENETGRDKIHTEETAQDAYNRSINRIMKFYDQFRESAIHNDINMFSIALDDFVNNI